MNEQMLQERVALNKIVRVRKLFFRLSKLGLEEYKKAIISLLPTRFWQHFGYVRLYEFLVDETRLDYDSAGDIVVEAIQMQYEEGGLYEDKLKSE